MKNYFCILRDILSLKDFFNEILPSTNFLESDSGQRISNSNEISQILFITEIRIISFFCSYVSHKSIQITPLTILIVYFKTTKRKKSLYPDFNFHHIRVRATGNSRSGIPGNPSSWNSRQEFLGILNISQNYYLFWIRYVKPVTMVIRYTGRYANRQCRPSLSDDKNDIRYGPTPTVSACRQRWLVWRGLYVTVSLTRLIVSE